MNPESINIYDRLPDDHELIEKYQPKFINRGGDHLVYEVVDHPEIVIKASTFKIKDIISENAESGGELNSLSDIQRENLQKELDEKNQQIKELRQYFGKEHTLSERRYLMKVPISKQILDEIFFDDWKNRELPIGSDDLNEVWSAVIVQKYTEEISNPEHLSLNFGGFLEERGYDSAEYKKINDAFILRHNVSSEDIELFFKLQDNPEKHALADIINKAESDQKLRDVLEDFITRTIKYTNETGNILALSGQDNIILYEKDGDWQYLLVDAVPVHNEPVFKDAQDAIDRYLQGEELSKHEMTLIMKSLNFTRVINGISSSLAFSDGLNLVEQLGDNKDIDFEKLLNNS